MEIPSKNRIDILYERNKQHYICQELPSGVDIQYKDFKIEKPGKPTEFFRVDINNLENPRISEMNALLLDDEIIADPGVYCWVLGEITNPGETHIYAKKSESIQEIQSKHINIVREVMLSTDLKDVHECGFKILYAGEVKVEINKKGSVSLEFNFLSGTFMAERDDISSRNIADAINITLYYFATILGTRRINYDGSYETFITRQMRKDDILNYMSLGANIYRYPTEEAFKDSSRLQRKKMNEYGKQQHLQHIIGHRYTSAEDKVKFQRELEQSQNHVIELEHYHDPFLLHNPDEIGLGKKKSKNNRKSKKNKKEQKVKKNKSKKNKKSKKTRR
jgi:hypothetical protein